MTRADGRVLSADRTLRAETKLYCDLFAPDAAPAPLLVALHGYGSSKAWMTREAREHAPEGFAVAALQGPHQHLKEPREPGGPNCRASRASFGHGRPARSADARL